MNDKCWYCGGQLIWNSDYAYDEVCSSCDTCTKSSCDGIATSLTCSNCGADIVYSLPCSDRRIEDSLEDSSIH